MQRRFRGFRRLINGSDNEFSGNTITGSTAESYDFIRDGSAFEIFNGSRNNIHHNTAVDNNVFSEIGRSKGPPPTATPTGTTSSAPPAARTAPRPRA